MLWSRSNGCAERFNGCGNGARTGRGGSWDGLTSKRSLRAAEMCDRAEHRSMRLQTEAKICQTWALGQAPNGKCLLFPSSCGLVPRPAVLPVRRSIRDHGSLCGPRRGSAREKASRLPRAYAHNGTKCQRAPQGGGGRSNNRPLLVLYTVHVVTISSKLLVRLSTGFSLTPKNRWSRSLILHSPAGHWRPCRRSGDPPRLCREGKQKLTESPREFLKASARQSPEGSL